MARALWTGAISFGLVNVPVRLYTAVAHREVHFHMLHGRDGGRIQFKRVCSVDGHEVPFEQIVKGFEISKGRFVIIDPAELEKLDPKATHTIDISDFVHLNEIDPIYYDSTYYVAPDERGGKAYALLVTAMEEAGKVAIARMVLRTRQSVCALRPKDGRLLLSTMQYADEIVPVSALDLPKAGSAPRGRELEMATQLIDSLTTDFEPSKYKDDYRAQVLELVERKAEGKQIVAPEAPAQVEVGNLADALAASLANARHTSEIGQRRAPPARVAARTQRAPAHARAKRSKS